MSEHGNEHIGARSAAVCPECGAPRGADRSPSCDCTARAAKVLRETRTAEAAAAEDFDPLRIRPYVEMPDQDPGAAATASLPVVVGATLPPGPARADPPVWQRDGGPAAQETGRGRRRTVLLSVAGVGAAVLAVAGFALFSYHAPSRDRDRAAAEEVRASVPDVTAQRSASPTARTATATPPPPPQAAPAASPPSPSATAGASPSPTPSPTHSATASPSASRAPSATASAAPGATPAAGPVLRTGDSGPQVVELQERLRQLNLYDDPVDGVYDRPVWDAVRTYQLARGIQGDTLGEYGPATRASLEAETSKP
ncbi:peptidoglycan-binding protein [Streptomyces sp. NPDC127190]|uniref:peptidoglycan-binding domain-containing protein n=1 Tax=unclassified Streptomyces TaxID=2593676 RepID=UPI003628D198